MLKSFLYWAIQRWSAPLPINLQSWVGSYAYDVLKVCKNALTCRVWYILGYQTVGCYKDTRRRAISTLEGNDLILDGSYWTRKDPIAKCAVAALKRGYTMFAVQNGGWCAASPIASTTYFKYGRSSACKSDGEGGPWANQVYAIRVKGKCWVTCIAVLGNFKVYMSNFFLRFSAVQYV